MMCRRTDDGVMMVLMKPLCIGLILAGLFGLIWLRSSVVKEAYEIRALEEMKTGKLKEAKMLLARRAELASLEHLGVTLRGEAAGLSDEKEAYVFPARAKVIHVKGGGNAEPYKATFKVNIR